LRGRINFNHFILNNKGSYRQKLNARMGTSRTEALPKGAFFKIDESTKFLFEEGQLLLIDKPIHWTSFDVVKKIRALIRIKKIGHAGTLDPLASGLLIVCTGKLTKSINELMTKEKSYSGTFTLGATTASYDLETPPTDSKDISEITPNLIHSIRDSFLGETAQFPPIYSAIKKEGVPLYELARKGTEIELKSRKIFIKNFEIIGIEMPFVHFNITCSTGTYIRSVANDFGQKLGCGAYLSSLRRTAIGDISVDQAMVIDDVKEFIMRLNEDNNQNE